jgi:hypothetical protein
MPGIGFRLILNWPAKSSFGGAFQREDSVCHSEMPGVRALQVDDAPQRVGACAPRYTATTVWGGDSFQSDGFHQTRKCCLVPPSLERRQGKKIQPGINNWDVGLSKLFQFTERVGFQFRAETFNTFNHTQYGVDPTTAAAGAPGQSAVSDNISNANFGQMTSAVREESCSWEGRSSSRHLPTQRTASFRWVAVSIRRQFLGVHSET